ncbi:MAG: hypothetical protein ACTSRA_15910, partial [Promethearchaeota archaeon]
IFHPAHHDKPFVNKRLRQFINDAKDMGARFMTSREIGEWVFLRKKAVLNHDLSLPGLGDVVVLVRDTALHEWARKH